LEGEEPDGAFIWYVRTTSLKIDTVPLRDVADYLEQWDPNREI
ncbi:MAG: hypothetical protein RL276_1251, partial [Bacteroidota bacterium]